MNTVWGYLTVGAGVGRKFRQFVRKSCFAEFVQPAPVGCRTKCEFCGNSDATLGGVTLAKPESPAFCTAQNVPQPVNSCAVWESCVHVLHFQRQFAGDTKFRLMKPGGR